MPQGMWNGSSYFAAYRLNAAHTGIIAADGTGSVIGSPTTADAALILEDDTANDIIVQTSDWTPDKVGVNTCTVETSDPTVEEFLETAAPSTSSSSSSVVKKEYTSEVGGKIGGAGSSSGVPYLVISSLQQNDTEVLTKMAIVNFSPESGKIKTTSGDIAMWGLKFSTVAAKAALAIPNALFPTSVYDIDPAISAGDRTVASGAYIKTSMLPKAA